MQWLEEHEDTWKEAIRAVKAGVRKAVHQRIVPHADVPQKDPCARMQPRAKDVMPSWAGKVADGWHTLSPEGWRIVIFAVGTQGDARPNVALGQGLARAGHTVVIVTSRDFEGLVRDAGLGFAPLSDDTPNFYVENKQEKRVNVTQESLTAALEEAAEVQRRANEAYVKQFGQWPAELEALAKKE